MHRAIYDKLLCDLTWVTLRAKGNAANYFPKKQVLTEIPGNRKWECSRKKWTEQVRSSLMR